MAQMNSDGKDNEEQVISELRDICDSRGREKEPAESAVLLHQLGKLYRQKSPDKLSLVQSAALFNAAIVRNPENVEEIRSDLNELCLHVLRLAKAKHPDENLIQAAEELFDNVKSMRTNALSELANSPSRAAFHSSMEYEERNINFVLDLQDRITSDYTEVMRCVSEYAIKVMGEAPCRYCHVALGSLARKEVTPFSDFESIIVLQEGVQRSIAYPNFLEYFRWYTIVLQLIILNFGETIIPSVAISSLNDFSERGKDWFFDVHTPRGISFDGLMPYASKNPLGRHQKTKQKPWKTELIKPISLMLEYLESKNDIKNGYHLADILTTTRFVSGDLEICGEFQSKILRFSGTESHSSSFNRMLEIIHEDLESYAVFDNLALAYKRKNLNTKRMIYRSSTIFISTLGKIHNLRSVSSFDIVSELEEKHVISSKAAHNLKFAVAIACKVRLKTYMENMSQSENLSLNLKSDSSQEDNLDLGNIIDINDAIEYFKITFCLQRNIRSGYQEKYSDDMRTVEKHVEAGICFCFFQYRAALEIGRDLREFYLNEKNPEKVAAFTWFIKECLYLLEKFAEALEEARYELSQELQVKPQNLQNIAKCHQAAAKCLLKMNEPLQAAKEFENELNTHKRMPTNAQTDENILTCLKNIANAYYSSSQFDIALQWFQQEKHEYETNFNLLANHRHDLSKCFGNIGGCLFRLDQYENALEHYKQAKRIIELEGATPEAIAFYWNMIGHCFFKMNRAEEALRSYQEEFTKLKNVTGVDVKKIDSINNIARCLRNLNRHEEAETIEKMI